MTDTQRLRAVNLCVAEVAKLEPRIPEAAAREWLTSAWSKFTSLPHVPEMAAVWIDDVVVRLSPDGPQAARAMLRSRR